MREIAYTVCVILMSAMLIFTPVAFVIATASTIRKKATKKKWWFICLGAFVLMIAFAGVCSVVECNHEWVLTSESVSTCIDRGKTVYSCAICEREKTEYVDAIGHDLRILSRIEPTETLDGEIVRRCERCGSEKVEIVAKLEVSTIPDEVPDEIVNSPIPPAHTDKSTAVPTTEPESTPDEFSDTASESETSSKVENTPPFLPEGTSQKPTDDFMPENSMKPVLIEIGYTETEVTGIMKVLNSIGITSFEVIIADEETKDGMRVVACYFNESDTSAFFSTTHGEISVVGSSGEVWYDTEHGGILSQYEAPEPTRSEKTGEYSEAFMAACAEISLDTGLIKNWESIDDWANGARFRFVYERQSVLAYMGADGTVDSINIGRTKVYERGYEPYNVNDYIVDTDIAYALVPYAEDTVKLALNYPSTADFPFFDWAYGREGDVYMLQSSVEARNGFGIESEIPFTVMFDIGTKGKAICVYLQLDGVVVVDERESLPERAEIKKE